MTKAGFESTILVGYAAQEIADNAKLIIGVLRARTPDLAAHMDAIDPDVASTFGDELARVMYEAACAHLAAKGLEYPPFRPEVFLSMEDRAAKLRAKLSTPPS